MLLNIAHSISLPLGQADAFALVFDPHKFSRWMQNFRSRQPLGPLDGVPGALSRHEQHAQGRKIVFTEEILSVESPNFFAVRLISNDLDVESQFHFTPDESGTMLEVREELRLKSWFMLGVSAFVRPISEKRLREDLARLEKLAQLEKSPK